ncbi:MAG TPA: hypothetical protein VFG81_01690 [Anaerolineales bacterium]|jgi:hypothetical protein|nr:hypothetical protein [Anaerolineales bacterium]
MKNKLYSLVSVLLVLIVMATPVSAGGAVKLSGVSFSLGSLIANGTLTGLGNTDVSVVIEASGIPAITCINFGKNRVPGQSYPKVSASGNQFLDGDSPVRRNGKSPFGVETIDPESIPWNEAGCPNANWTGHIDFIFWTDASISVFNASTQALLLKKEYTCTTTLTGVSCTPK